MLRTYLDAEVTVGSIIIWDAEDCRWYLPPSHHSPFTQPGASMAARKVYDVSPDGNGWKVQQRNGNYRSNHSTKAAAISTGTTVARANAPSQLVIRRADGTIEDERTYSNDPYPPRG